MSTLCTITPITITKDNKAIRAILDSVDPKRNALGYKHNQFSIYYGAFLEDDSLIGFSQFIEPNMETNEILLATLAIHKSHQGQGIGSRLLNHSINNLQIKYPDLSTVRLIATESSTDFYLQQGFIQNGSRLIKKLGKSNITRQIENLLSSLRAEQNKKN